MKSDMVFRFFNTVLLFFFLGWCPAQAAEFTLKEISYALQEGYLTVKGAQGISVAPERKLLIHVSGDSQDSPDSGICLICYQQQYKDKVFEEKIKIANNRTKTWTFSPDQKIQTCEILMGKTGGIKYRAEQPALPK